MLAPFPAPLPLPLPLPLPDALHARDVTLPPARAADLQPLADLYAVSRMPDLLLAPWPPERKRSFLDEQFALQHAHFVKHHRKGHFRLVARQGTRIGRFYFDCSLPEWVLIDILLGPGAQGSGIGGALIGWLQQAAREAGAVGLRLSVARTNPRARALYQRLGFIDASDVAGTHIAMVWRP